MKFLNLKFNSKELKTIRDALLSEKGELLRLKEDPNFLKELDKEHKEFHLNNDIQHIKRLIEYIQSKEKLFI